MSNSPSSDPSASAAPGARGAAPSHSHGRKISVVTGANRGIGRAIAGELGERGHRVICLCRTEERARQTAHELAQEVGRESFGWAHADLTRPDQIEAAAKTIRERHPSIDLLMNNAGYSTLEYRESEEGVEETLAINHLGTVRLTLALLPSLLTPDASRIVIVSSQAHSRKWAPETFDGPKGFDGRQAYAQAKLLNLLFTLDLARALDHTGVDVNAVHPGLVATGLLDDLIGSSLLATPFLALARLIAKGPADGAETPIHVATASELEGSSGGYFVKRKRRNPRPVAEDRKVQEEARRWTAELAGVDWGARVEDLLAD